MSIKSYAWVTLTQVKNYLDLSTGSTTYDATLTLLINGVTDLIEKQTGGRRLARPSAASTGYYDGGDGNRTRLVLRDWPISSSGITTLAYNSGTFDTPVWTSFNTNDYQVYSDNGIIQIPAGVPAGNKNIKVVALLGYDNSTGSSGANFPTDLTLLALRLIGKMWNLRKSEGIKSESLGAASITWDTALSAFDNNDKAILNAYKRLAF